MAFCMSWWAMGRWLAIKAYGFVAINKVILVMALDPSTALQLRLSPQNEATPSRRIDLTTSGGNFLD